MMIVIKILSYHSKTRVCSLVVPSHLWIRRCAPGDHCDHDYDPDDLRDDPDDLPDDRDDLDNNLPSTADQRLEDAELDAKRSRRSQPWSSTSPSGLSYF